VSLPNPTCNKLGPCSVPGVRSIASACRNITVTGVHAVAFWGAIALPFPVLGILYGGYTDQHLQLLTALVVMHALCLVVGHDYKRENDDQ